VIAEEEVPLGGGEAEAENGENSSGGEESGTAEIAEEEIPLGAESSGTVSLAVYLGGLAIVAMLAGAAVAYAKSKKKK
jgi:hypothetical protein